MNEYYYLNSHQVPQGPHTLADLAELMATGRVNPTTLVACKGGSRWEPLGTVLAREQISLPDVTLSPGQVGHCPSCGYDLAPNVKEGKLPARCPQCLRALAPAKPGIWANFCLALRNYARFSGRATRAEYWSFQLINFLIVMGLYLALVASTFTLILTRGAETLQQITEAEDDDQAAEAVIASLNGDSTTLWALIFFALIATILAWALAVILPGLSVTVRRMHDVGWSGWWLVLCSALSIIMPILIGIVAAVSTPDTDIAFIILTVLYNLLASGISIFLLVLMVLDSQRGANKFGPSSKYPLG